MEGKRLQVILSLLLSLLGFVLHNLSILFFFRASLVFMLWLFNMFLFGYFLVLHFFVFHIKIKKIEKSEKYKKSVCFVYIGTCVLWMAIETKFSELCISCSLDEHLYTQLSK